MFGLYCEKNNCCMIPSNKCIDIINISNKCNSYFNRKYINEELLYDQKSCTFCSEDFLSSNNSLLGNLIIILECGHVFHLNCFIYYMKWVYVEDNGNKQDHKTSLENKQVKCSLCRLETPDFLTVFTEYKELLKHIRDIKSSM
jgi:hypothetical protein